MHIFKPTLFALGILFLVFACKNDNIQEPETTFTNVIIDSTTSTVENLLFINLGAISENTQLMGIEIITLDGDVITLYVRIAGELVPGEYMYEKANDPQMDFNKIGPHGGVLTYKDKEYVLLQYELKISALQGNNNYQYMLELKNGKAVPTLEAMLGNYSHQINVNAGAAW